MIVYLVGKVAAQTCMCGTINSLGVEVNLARRVGMSLLTAVAYLAGKLLPAFLVVAAEFL